MFKGSKYANVTSTLALVVALGGTGAYAANTIGSSDIKNSSIRSIDIKGKEVKNSDLANSAVTGAKVKNGTLLANDFKSGQIPAGATGPAGPAGPRGAAGPAGPAGAAGSSVAYARVNADGSLDTTNSKNITAANVARTALGTYCFSNLPFTVKSVIATPDAYGPTNGSHVNTTFHGARPYGGCTEQGSGGRVLVTNSANAAADQPFYIVFE